MIGKIKEFDFSMTSKVSKLGEWEKIISRTLFQCGRVAQLGEHQAGSLRVVGSIPISSIFSFNIDILQW